MSEYTKSLRKIEDESLELNRILEDCEGELTPEIEERLKINEDELAVKIDNYSGRLSFLENSIERDKKLIKELQQRVKNRQRAIDWMELQIKTGMLNKGVDRLEGNLSSFELKTAGGAAKLNIDESLLPPPSEDMDFWSKTWVLDKASLRSYLEKGVEVPGASLTRSYVLKRKVMNKLGEKK